jgi:hypothetical protein
MSQAEFSAFERFFDRAVAVVIIAMGAAVATATAFAGV